MICLKCNSDRVGHWIGSNWVQYQCYKCNEVWFKELKDDNRNREVDRGDLAGTDHTVANLVNEYRGSA